MKRWRWGAAALVVVVACVAAAVGVQQSNSPPYRNVFGEMVEPKGVWAFLKWRVLEGGKLPPEDVREGLDPNYRYPANRWPEAAAGDDAVAWVNHSSFVLKLSGTTAGTDPMWSKRASPLSFVGPARMVEPALEASILDELDVVVISHNHYDHLDVDTVARIPDRVWFVVPLGIDQWLREQGKTNVVGLNWWQSHRIKNIDITLVPAQHWSKRTLSDTNQSLWGGFVIQSPQRRVYFAGDTGYNKEMFEQIAQKFAPVDLALLPIGAYLPRNFMRNMHINPQEAVTIAQHMQAAKAAAMHFGTFQLGADTPERAMADLADAVTAAGWSDQRFSVLTPGRWLSIGATAPQ